LTFLDPDREIPRPRAYGFEALAAGVHAQIEQAHGRLSTNQSRMAADLATSPTGELEAALARAIGAHAAALAGEGMSFADPLGQAHALDEEAAFVQGGFPAENERPPLPATGSAGILDIPPLPGTGAPAPAPGSGGAPGGDAGGAPGGDAGGDVEYEGRGDPRVDAAYRILRAIGTQEGASVERSDPRLLVEKADGIDRYAGSLEAAAEAEFRPQYRRRGGH